MATPAKQKDPKTVTIYGRLSYPTFEYARAVARNATSQYKKADPAEVKPDFNLLVEQPQLDKLITHVKDVYLPYCVEQAGQPGATIGKKDALGVAEVKRILKVIDDGDWEAQPPYIPIKKISDATALLAPECVAAIKVVGNNGTDIELRAIVNNEDELSTAAAAKGDIITFPCILPIGQTVHSMYGGCYVAATLNLYSFISGKLPGFSGSSSVAVFKTDGDRFGGGVAVDEDEIFLD